MVKAPPPAGVDASAAPASAGLKSTEPARGDQTAAGPEHAMAKDSLPRDDAPRAAGPEDPTAPPRHSSDLTPPPPSPAVEQRAKPSRRDDDADTKEAESSPRMKIGHRRPRVPGYEILDVLGDGGMGVVYKARQRYPERIVALKMIRAGEIASPSILARFETEINAVAKLHHANIVQLYEIGECDGLPFFTMEYLEGGSLHDMLPKRRHTPHEAAALVELLARAVHYAHERGIVHRDLKPGNVLLTAAGELKISDFGLAKVLGGSSHPAVTISGTPMGTPEYMSPEQAAGAKEIGPASDVYSLGVMLYELLTGQRPFHGDNVLDKVRTEEAPSPAWATSVPRDLETICLKCLRKEPKQRYATALELADDLRRFAEGKPITGQRPSLLRRLRHQIKHRPRRAAGVALALALVAGALGAWAWGDAY
jgi:serine/threonine protein kinase